LRNTLCTLFMHAQHTTNNRVLADAATMRLHQRTKLAKLLPPPRHPRLLLTALTTSLVCSL
jgi:hypothetical protein